MTTGTNNTVPREFSSKDLCRIIETCHKNGVSKLNFGDVSIDFSNSPDFPQDGPQVLQDFGDNTDFVTEATDEAGVVDEGLLEEARVSQLMIDDPISFEQEMIDTLIDKQRLRHAQL